VPWAKIKNNVVNGTGWSSTIANPYTLVPILPRACPAGAARSCRRAVFKIKKP
jgi:hypothetical protein